MPDASNRVEPSGEGPAVRLVDSTVYPEPDSVALGARVVFTRGADGTTFAADAEAGAIVRYGPDDEGPLLIGRRGDGPGEFRSPGTMHLLAHDSLLAVVDFRRRYLSVLDSRSGRFLRGFPTPFTLAGTSWSVRDETVWFTVFPAAGLMARWNWRTDSVAVVVPVPDWIQQAQQTVALYGWPEAVVRESTVLALIPTEPGLDLFGLDGRFLGQVLLPAARRLGNPRDLIARHRALERRGEEFRFLASTPAGISELSTGMIAVLMVDVERASPGSRTPVAVKGYYLSLLSPDLSRVCVDGVVPFASDGLSIPSFDHDTLAVFARQVRDDGTVRSVLYRFAISPATCAWRATQRARGPS